MYHVVLVPLNKSHQVISVFYCPNITCKGHILGLSIIFFDFFSFTVYIHPAYSGPASYLPIQGKFYCFTYCITRINPGSTMTLTRIKSDWGE